MCFKLEKGCKTQNVCCITLVMIFSSHYHVADCVNRSMGSINEAESTYLTRPPQITTIVAYSKGFACACGPGIVHLFEKTDDKDFFKKTREIKVVWLMSMHIAVPKFELFTSSPR